jgi:transcriptional regulator with XRE-family HTH domain
MAQRIFNTNIPRKERERIGELVKALRNDSGISQKDLAFKVGVSPARISQIEKGTLDYRIDTLIVILDHFGSKISFFNEHFSDLTKKG